MSEVSSARRSRTAFTRLLTPSVSARPSLKKIEWMCFSTARVVSTRDLAIAELLLPWAISVKDLLLARGEFGERRVRARVCVHETLDDLGIDDRAAGSDGLDGGHELRAVTHTLLEQVRAPVGAGLEELQRVTRLRVVAEDHHTNLGMELAEATCDLDALVCTRGRHSNVGDHDVGRVGLNRLEERRHVVARGNDLDALVSGEELLQPLQDEEAVVREGDANRHRRNDRQVTVATNVSMR